MCKAKQTPMIMATRKSSLERLLKKKNILCIFYDGPQKPAHATKSGYNVQISPVGSGRVLR